jgi:hypothetical protein
VTAQSWLSNIDNFHPNVVIQNWAAESMNSEDYGRPSVSREDG